jgi:hypothetical protein
MCHQNNLVCSEFAGLGMRYYNCFLHGGETPELLPACLGTVVMLVARLLLK